MENDETGKWNWMLCSQLSSLKFVLYNSIKPERWPIKETQREKGISFLCHKNVQDHPWFPFVWHPKHDDVCEELLQELEKTAKEDKYYKDIKKEYQTLKDKLAANKKDDLHTFKDEIKYVYL